MAMIKGYKQIRKCNCGEDIKGKFYGNTKCRKCQIESLREKAKDWES